MLAHPRLLTTLLLTLLTLPVLVGLWGTLRLALSHPGGLTRATADLAQWPGLPRAIALSLLPGLVATTVALGLTLALLAFFADTPTFRILRRLLSPLLAVPHAAAALGLAFLIAPSGWIARALSPWATGWTVPPDLQIVGDPMGITLTLGLIAKELPFLLLLALAAWPGLDAALRLTLMHSLGHGRALGFAIALLPPLYAKLRLPVYAVLAYAMTSVEMGRILGPGLPPPLSVQVTIWLMDPSLVARPIGAAGALLQLGLVILALGLWRGAEVLGARLLRHHAATGRRQNRADAPFAALTLSATLLILALTFAGLASLGLWSIAGLWPFPATLPDGFSLKVWTQAATDLGQTAALTTAIATVTALLATVIAVPLVQGARVPALLYLPLILPQVAFLPGLTSALLALGVRDGPFAVTLLHLIFVLPYAVLSLSGPSRALDPRFDLAAAALGASPARIFWRIRLPLLFAPLLTTFAIGFAVSLAQYLPTLLAGGGRVETLTTEAVALASGSNRRLAGAYGTLQLILPALAFGLAIALPRLVYRNRAALKGP